ncbi:MAG TPA: deiodinase-like protein [Pirellulaceae bacterium]|nr:deiodinase-like protein [Pirellulaceae bacterium]
MTARRILTGMLLLASVATIVAAGNTVLRWQAAIASLATPVLVLPPHPAPRVGQMAPDFELPSADGSRSVRLSSFRGQRPVALVFASITCPYFRNEAQALERLYRQYGDQVQFLLVYQREAHSVGTTPVPENDADGIAICPPQSLAERSQDCQQAGHKLSLTIPSLVDQLNDRVAYDYMSDPVRLYLVDVSGKIVFQTAQGPWSFRAQDLEQAILASLPAVP